MTEKKLPCPEEERFGVCQFFIDGSYERVVFDVPPEDAVRIAISLATSAGGRIGTTREVIVTDSGDSCVWQWQFGKGVTFPPEWIGKL